MLINIQLLWTFIYSFSIMFIAYSVIKIKTKNWTNIKRSIWFSRYFFLHQKNIWNCRFFHETIEKKMYFKLNTKFLSTIEKYHNWPHQCVWKWDKSSCISLFYFPNLICIPFDKWNFRRNKKKLTWMVDIIIIDTHSIVSNYKRLV